MVVQILAIMPVEGKKEEWLMIVLMNIAGYFADFRVPARRHLEVGVGLLPIFQKRWEAAKGDAHHAVGEKLARGVMDLWLEVGEIDPGSRITLIQDIGAALTLTSMACHLTEVESLRRGALKACELAANELVEKLEINPLVLPGLGIHSQPGELVKRFIAS